MRRGYWGVPVLNGWRLAPDIAVLVGTKDCIVAKEGFMISWSAGPRTAKCKQ